MRYNSVSTPLRAEQTALHRVGLSIATIPVQPLAGEIPPEPRPYGASRSGSGTTPRRPDLPPPCARRPISFRSMPKPCSA